MRTFHRPRETKSMAFWGAGLAGTDCHTAILLSSLAGFQVSGVFVHNPYEDKESEEFRLDRADHAARLLGIPIKEISLTSRQWERLVR